MNDHQMEMRDLIIDYNLVNGSLGFVSVETLIIAIIIGASTHSLGWGIGSFIILILLYGVPLIGGVFSLCFSFVEAIVIGAILSLMGTSLGWSYFIGIVAFVILTFMHRIFGAVANPVLFGYSYIIFNDLLISGIIYVLSEMLPLTIIVFVVILVVAFIPVLRIIELIVLGIGTAIFTYAAANNYLEVWQSLLVAGFAAVYSGYSYSYAYTGVDYIEMVKSRKKAMVQQENESRINQIKGDIYNKFPELEKNYYYFYTEVCKTSFSKMQFDFDWNNYLEYLDRTSETISFNEYFEQEKLYRTSHYNSDFAQKHSEWGGSTSHENKKEKVDNSGNKNSIYFTGVDSLESLKKRYHDLIKIYHPDNQNGDNTISQQIQKEYERLLKEYEDN